VPIDYSLRSYLEVIFLDPRMKIKVQGSLVKSRPLARFLHKTNIENGFVLGKQVQLVLGHSQPDLEQGNCGIFLYWHGRLIEAYKRVGSMIHNGEKSHGILGVIDVTGVMDDGNNHVWVHNNKQGFVDCEPYALLEDWLSKKVDEYLDNTIDKVYVKKGGPRHKPDHEWVQCNKCRKWRMLDPDFDCKTLPLEWFCYMKPINGKCEMPEQKVEPGVITISSRRSGYDTKENSPNQNNQLKSKQEEGSNMTLASVVNALLVYARHVHVFLTYFLCETMGQAIFVEEERKAAEDEQKRKADEAEAKAKEEEEATISKATKEKAKAAGEKSEKKTIKTRIKEAKGVKVTKVSGTKDKLKDMKKATEEEARKQAHEQGKKKEDKKAAQAKDEKQKSIKKASKQKHVEDTEDNEENAEEIDDTEENVSDNEEYDDQSDDAADKEKADEEIEKRKATLIAELKAIEKRAEKHAKVAAETEDETDNEDDADQNDDVDEVLTNIETLPFLNTPKRSKKKEDGKESEEEEEEVRKLIKIKMEKGAEEEYNESDYEEEPNQVKKAKKTRGSKVEKPYPTCHTQSSTKALYEAMMSLSDPRKKCLKEMGFERMIHFPIVELPSSFTFHVIEHFHPASMELRLERGSIKITRQKVNDMLGIPMGSRRLEDREEKPSNDPFIKQWEE
ncbi:MORC family CW-type zinc finger protein 2B-like protein isoform X1, partial [Tanacetum coccineum]